MKSDVLVVHGNLTVRMDLRSVLTTAGFAVTACETLTLARKMLRDKTFSLVVLDLVLPDGNGHDFLWHMRSSPDFNNVPVMLLTAGSEAQSRTRGAGTQPEEYISKPYDRDDLARRATALVERKPSEPAPPSSAKEASLAGKRFLVVDDSPTYRETLAQLLRRSGSHVVLARSGEEALKVLEVERVDCVIVDLLMPGMGGMATAEQIKCDPALADTAVVVLAGLDDFKVRAQGVAAGIDDLVLKSPDLPQLTARLQRVFRKRAEQSPRPASIRVSRSSVPPAPASGAPGWTGQDSEVVSPRTSSLLTKVIAASGLSSAIGPSTIFRTCKHAGIEPMSMSPADLYRAIPNIQRTLSSLLTEDECRRSIAAITSLARSSAA
jgi:DNA-binding response OmpR family regulator